MRATGTGRSAGALQGWVLISLTWVSAIAVVGIAPALPQMAAAFAGEPGLGVKIGLIATLPSLGVALCAWPYGLLADRIGRRVIAIWALLAYGLLGLAPLALSSLNAIVVARAAVGLAEAAIMTCATAMLVDYFHGAARDRWLALQTGVAPIVATMVLFLAGMLGEHGWRMPFLAYCLALVPLPFLLLFTWEPVAERRDTPLPSVEEPADADFRWSRQLMIAAVTMVAMIGFMITIIQVPFFLTARGLADPGRIGLIAAGISVATPLGSLLFSQMRWGTAQRLTFAFAMYALGFAIIGLGHGVMPVIAGAVVANLGGGFMMPTCITWALGSVRFDKRGAASGLFQSALFFGQFVSPLIFLALTTMMGDRDMAVILCASVAGLAALAAVSQKIWRKIESGRAL